VPLRIIEAIVAKPICCGYVTNIALLIIWLDDWCVGLWASSCQVGVLVER